MDEGKKEWIPWGHSVHHVDDERGFSYAKYTRTFVRSFFARSLSRSTKGSAKMKILCRISFPWDEINSFFAKFFSEIFPLLLMHICMKIKQRLRTRLLTHGIQKLMFEFYSSSFQMLARCLFVCLFHSRILICLLLSCSCSFTRESSRFSFIFFCAYVNIWFFSVRFISLSLARTHAHSLWPISLCASVGQFKNRIIDGSVIMFAF